MTDRLRAAIREVPDFPKPGVVFKDITPVLADAELFHEAIGWFSRRLAGTGVTKVAGIDARGFIFASAVAYELRAGFVPIRKKGKLPWTTQEAAYSLEYGESVIEMHTDAVARGEKVALVDDVLATGGTAGAALKLLRNAGAEVVAVQFFIELGYLGGRAKLETANVESAVMY
jgi:adenine phosphoribosyltransferase